MNRKHYIVVQDPNELISIHSMSTKNFCQTLQLTKFKKFKRLTIFLRLRCLPRQDYLHYLKFYIFLSAMLSNLSESSSLLNQLKHQFIRKQVYVVTKPLVLNRWVLKETQDSKILKMQLKKYLLWIFSQLFTKRWPFVMYISSSSLSIKPPLGLAWP